ncbi:MAG: hypothetical protein C0631_01975 [Sedimenticola sp.]|jgi:hypothetical protein|nr:MAG: hypothetical protein C0631_01975 [Sedimenticola sp.]
MKNALLFILILILTVLAAISGWAVGKLSNSSSELSLTQREKELSVAVENYSPTCEQLSSEGVHGPVNINNNLLIVKVEKDYFHVLGFNTDPGLPPVSWWWGASREAAVAQACDKS